jgi:plastocyanin
MASRLRWALCAAAGIALAAPGAAQGATKSVFMGTPPTASKAQRQALEKAAADVNAFFPRTVRIHAGDVVSFVPVGFHSVDLPGGGRKAALPFVGPTSTRAANALDAAGTPFWFNGLLPTLAFHPRLVASNFGKLKSYDKQSVISGLPLSENVKPMRVRFPKAGLHRYYCNIHPGMAGSVRVVGRNRPVPSKRADAGAVARQLAAAVAVARKLPNATGLPPNTISVAQEGKGGVHHFGFVPSRLTVPAGTTVTLATPASSTDIHTATFGPGDASKDPRKEPGNYMAKLASTFAGPGPFDPIGTYSSEPPKSPPAALSPALHGNGFWNSGLVGGSLTGLPRGAQVRFGTPGTYTFYCLIHTNMTGTITVQ